MIQAIFYEKKNYLTLLFWLITGLFSSTLVFVVVPVHLLLLHQRENWLLILLGFWFVLMLSDSRNDALSFAKTLKTFVIVTISLIYLLREAKNDSFQFVIPFIPFFIVSFYSLIDSPNIFYAFQKTLSYFLLLSIIPGIVKILLVNQRERFLYNLVLLGTFFLTISLVASLFLPELTYSHGNRYRGLFGNPNGLAIFLTIFIGLFTYIQINYKYLFTKNQIWLVYGIILLSLILSGSRGAMLSVSIFIVGWILIRQNVIMGFTIMIIILSATHIIIENATEVITSLNLEDYFRMETIESGSGRVYAKEVAWEHIPENYWISKGFTYHETILEEYKDYFLEKGHQGHFHNSWLTMWLDTGLIGLILFCFGWFVNFIRAARFSPMVWALFFVVIISNSVESWLTASLNPFTIVLVIILSMMSHPAFYEPEEEMANGES